MIFDADGQQREGVTDGMIKKEKEIRYAAILHHKIQTQIRALED